jgi:hypothetical protein
VTASVEELAYAEGVRAVAEQSAVLEGLQARAGTLLAAASLVTSFLGGRALRGNFDFWSVVAVAAFVATSVLTIGVLWPRHRWLFVISAGGLLAAARTEGAADAARRAHEEVALRLERMFDENEETLRALFRTFRWACAFLIAEVVAWIADLV